MRAGDRVGPYELRSLLGTGGAGEVWESVLHGPGGFRKPVALKLVREDLAADDTLRETLIREARLGALVQHPNVVGTFGVSCHDGRWVVALELVRGASLAQLLKQSGAIGGRALLDLGVQAASGLAHVHELGGGVVHRDVKPANLLLDLDGFVKVADLGVSVRAGEAGGVAGTVGYMPPEQTDGRAEPRSDLFALGVTLVIAATVRRPFVVPRGGTLTPEAIRPVLDGPLLAALDAEAPGLTALVRRCLDPDPERRPATARALRDALAALRGEARDGPTLAERVHGIASGPAVQETPTLDVPTRIVPNGNLRPVRDRFVGRAALLRDVRDAVLGGGRWLLLHGPGGIGKTRLSLEVARALQGQLRGGAWAFDLAEATTAEQLCASIARAFGIAVEDRDPVLQLGRVLAARGRCLVVLDNLEQVTAHLPATVGRWLALAPEATFLGTSRLPSGILEERRFPVAGLPRDEALGLVEARLGPVDGEERSAAARLCDALGGWPLALELAVARIGGPVGVAQVLRGLSLDVLSTGSEARPERHRSLEASLRWSTDLLDPEARVALASLAVFEAPFPLEAAAEVLAQPDDAAALTLLGRLADASLLAVDASDPPARFSLHAMVRSFAAGLGDAALRHAAEVRHGRSVARLGSAEALQALARPGGPARFLRLAPRAPDVHAACGRALDRGDLGTAAAALRVAVAIASRAGDSGVVGLLARRLAGRPGLAPRHRAHALLAEARAHRVAGRFDASERLFREARAVAEADAQDNLADEAASALAWLDLFHGRLDPAEAAYRTLLGRARARGDLDREAEARLGLGRVAHARRRWPEARASLAASLRLARDLGDATAEVRALDALGRALMMSGDWDDAQRTLEAAIARARAIGYRAGEVPALVNLAAVMNRRERPRESLELLRHHLALVRELGDREREASGLGALARAYATLGDEAQAEACAREAWERLSEMGSPSRAEVALTQARRAIEAGRGDEAREWLGRAEAVPNADVSPALERGLLALVEGRLADAERELWSALAGARSDRNAVPEMLAAARLAQVLHAAGRGEEAARLCHEVLPLARELRVLPAIAELACRLATLAAAPGDPTSARLLAEADEALTGIEEPGEQVRARIARAEVAGRRGDLAAAEAGFAEVAAAAGRRADLRGELARARARCGLGPEARPGS